MHVSVIRYARFIQVNSILGSFDEICINLIFKHLYKNEF